MKLATIFEFRIFSFGPYSVLATAGLPSSALRSVCQASEAHLTRTGNWETPEKTANLPKAGVSGDFVGRPVTNL